MLDWAPAPNRELGLRAARLEDVLISEPPAFALLYRPESSARGRVEILIGPATVVSRIEEIPLRTLETAVDREIHDVLAIIPFRQVEERGFDAQDDCAPLIVLTVKQHGSLPITDALSMLPHSTSGLLSLDCDTNDGTYAEIVRRVLRDEIGHGEGSNFVIKRTFVAEIDRYSIQTALAIFRHLMVCERGAYWTFIVHTGDRTFIGATHERHATLAGGVVTMNPISGTFRYPSPNVSQADVLAFLADRKEGGELSMVLDEELKMLSRLCPLGPIVSGPYLKEMAHLAHTEYLIRGHSFLNVRQVLRETMFSPAVTGSPLKNACHVIAKHEPCGRGYYSGVLALITLNATGEHVLDSSIMIRTGEIDRDGQMQVSVGSTLVRDSNPDTEVSETWVKARGLLGAFGGAPDHFPYPGTMGEQVAKTRTRISDDPAVQCALALRGKSLASFWFSDPKDRTHMDPILMGCRALVVEADDWFTEMLAHQLRALGLDITVCPSDGELRITEFDLIIMGPGPGNPLDMDNRRIARLYALIRQAVDSGLPLFCVCLSHQILCSILGLKLVRNGTPNQGVQKEVNLFGKNQVVGFYNTFVARHGAESITSFGMGGHIDVSRDEGTGDVHALRGQRIASVQFHPESVLTENGVSILQGMIVPIVGGATM